MGDRHARPPLNLVQLLASGALPLIQEDSSRELVADWMVPWEHYVPIRYDLGDLVPKVKWLLANDDFARGVAERSWSHFASRMRRQDTYCYVWRLLRSLSLLNEQGSYGS